MSIFPAGRKRIITISVTKPNNHCMKQSLFILLLLPLLSAAQKKTEHYPNGNKSFEGDYTLGWKNYDARDYLNFDTAGKQKAVYATANQLQAAEKYTFPERVYDGKCTFYYDNGKISYTGEYIHGIKNGVFTYWYYNGQKEAERSYVNGLPGGTWKTWYINGKQHTQYDYKQLTPDQVDSTLQRRVYRPYSVYEKKNSAGREKQFTYQPETLRNMLSRETYHFTIQEQQLSENTNWDGDFLSWYENGAKQAEMHYKNNVRTGKWMFWDGSGKLLGQLTFTDGKITDGTYEGKGQEAEPVGIDPGMATTGAPATQVTDQTIFTYVEQMPTPSVDMQAYFSQNMIYPPAAAKNQIEGRVMVRFVINADGTASDVTAIRGIGAGCDDEAVRLIKAMPKWNPGKQNGRPVRCYYTIPIVFKMP